MSIDEIDRLAKRLSRSQREYVLEGPYPHWTQTRWALERKGIASQSHIDRLSDLGLAVRARLEETND